VPADLPADSFKEDFFGRRATEYFLMKEIEKDTIFFDESGGGVTFSGGEPLLQAEFLARMLARCAEKEIHTAVDTCGYADWSAFEAILGLTRLFLFDLKIMDDDLHRRLCGVSNRPVLDNLGRLARTGAKVRIRFPVVPGMTDARQNISDAAAYVRSLPNVEAVDLLPFHRIADAKYRRLALDNPMAEVAALSRQDVLPVAETFTAHGLSTTVGG
jgi:pyruvate formate lyase activating enzyme